MCLIFGIESGNVNRVVCELGRPLESLPCKCACNCRIEVTVKHIGRIKFVNDFGFVLIAVKRSVGDMICVYVWQKIAGTSMA